MDDFNTCGTPTKNIKSINKKLGISASSPLYSSYIIWWSHCSCLSSLSFTHFSFTISTAPILLHSLLYKSLLFPLTLWSLCLSPLQQTQPNLQYFNTYTQDLLYPHLQQFKQARLSSSSAFRIAIIFYYWFLWMFFYFPSLICTLAFSLLGVYCYNVIMLWLKILNTSPISFDLSETSEWFQFWLNDAK